LRHSFPISGAVWNFSKNKRPPEPADVSVAAASVEKLVAAERRLRSAGVREAHHLEDMAEGRTAEGTCTIIQIRTTNRPCRSRRAGPAQVAQQIYVQATLTKMCVRFYKARPWRTRWLAEGELEGFMRS